MSEHALEAALTSWDYSTAVLLDRLQGLTDDEYFWEPVPGCWTVTGDDEGWTATNDHEADPAPFTTIAWRLWHIFDCVESYSDRAFGTRATGLPWDRFVGSAIEAVTLVRRSFDHFRAELTAMGPRWADPIGDAFGPFADRDHADLCLHALREVNSHGAEVAMLRDLWFHRPTDE